MNAIEMKKTNINTNRVVNRNFLSNDEMLNYIKKCDRRMYRISAAKFDEEMFIVINYMTNRNQFENVVIIYKDNYSFNMICKILDIK